MIESIGRVFTGAGRAVQSAGSNIATLASRVARAVGSALKALASLPKNNPVAFGVGAALLLAVGLGAAAYFGWQKYGRTPSAAPE